jgi:hypothetical protein
MSRVGWWTLLARPNSAMSLMRVIDGSRSAAGRPLSTGELTDLQKDINSVYEAWWSDTGERTVLPLADWIQYCDCMISPVSIVTRLGVKGKGKVPRWGLLKQHYSLWLIVLLTPKGIPSFISRGAAHQRRAATSTSEGRNYGWNLANNPVIHVIC